MNLLRKIFAFLFTLVFIPVAFMGTFALAITDTYLNPDFYQTDEFTDLFYDVIVEEVANHLINSQPELSQFLSTEEIKEEVKTAIPPSVVSDLITDFLSQLKQIPLPDEITISTQEIKNNLPLVADRLFDKMSPDLPFETNSLEQEFQQELIDYIPPRLTIPLSDMPGDARQALVLILLGANHFVTSFLTSLTILIAIIGLIIWKPFKSCLRWMGAPLIYTGAILFGFLRIIILSATQIHPLAEVVLSPVFSYMATWSWGFLAIGAVAVITSFILPQSNEPKPPIPPPTV